MLFRELIASNGWHGARTRSSNCLGLQRAERGNNKDSCEKQSECANIEASGEHDEDPVIRATFTTATTKSDIPSKDSEVVSRAPDAEGEVDEVVSRGTDRLTARVRDDMMSPGLQSSATSSHPEVPTVDREGDEDQDHSSTQQGHVVVDVELHSVSESSSGS